MAQMLLFQKLSFLQSIAKINGFWIHTNNCCKAHVKKSIREKATTNFGELENCQWIIAFS